MSWVDRIAEAAYTSPSGERIVFAYENVSLTVDKKTAAFEFADADGTYVQDLGRTGRRYPLRVFFWGDDYDLAANAFEELLLEQGVGTLEHPLYGVADVVPFGTITRRDDLKTGANQAVFEVTFWETTGVVFPTVQDDPAAEVLTAIAIYNVAAAEAFEASTALANAGDRASFRFTYQRTLDQAADALRALADAQDSTRRQFEVIVDSINQGIDILIADPLTLAFQTTLLIQAPVRAINAADARLVAYGDLLTALISGDGALVTSTSSTAVVNKFHNDDLFAKSYLSGMALSVADAEFATKTSALLAVETLLDGLETLTDWRDDNFAFLMQVDTGEAWQQLQRAVALAAAALVDASFSLKQERRVVLDRPRTIVDLAAELYGEIDSVLDFLIVSNNLTGAEILELPRGREIVYYL